MKKVLFLLILSVIAIVVNAQNCSLQWKVKSNFYIHQLVTDSFGNSYAIGKKDSTQLFITKYDNMGNVIFENLYQLTGGKKVLTIYSALIDKDYNLLLTGTYKSTNNNTGIYILKYLTAGTLAWFNTADNNGKNNRIIGVEIKTDNIFITAQSDNNTLYLLKYDLTGAANWSNTNIASNTEKLIYVKSKIDDSNNIYIATMVTTTDSTFVTIQKYDVNGNLKWKTLNYKGIAFKDDKNLDFYVTDLGTSYTVFNVKNPQKSDTVVVTSYNTDGIVLFTHMQNLKEQTHGEQTFNLAVYGDEQSYIVRVTTTLFEQGNPTYFIQYDKNSILKWKHISSLVTYNYSYYNNKTNQLLASGTQSVTHSDLTQWSVFMALNTLNGTSTRLRHSSNNIIGREFVVTKNNNVFWVNFGMSLTVSKLITNPEVELLCNNFFNITNPIALILQSDKFENTYITSYTGDLKDSNFISKYSTTLGLKKTFDQSIDVSIYPNPATNLITVTSGQLNSLETLVISNSLGQILHTQHLHSEDLKELTLSIRSFPAGCYLLSIISKGMVVNKRFIKTE